MHQLRVLVLSSVLWVLADPCLAERVDVPAYIALEAERLHAGDVVAPGISRIVAAGQDTVILLENRPARLVRMLPDGRSETLIESGAAPWEVDSPECRMSRPRPRAERIGCGMLVLHALREPRSVGWDPVRGVFPIRSDRIVTSSVVRSNGVLAALFTSSSERHGALLGGTQQLGWFSTESRGEPEGRWLYERGHFPFEYTENPALNVARSYFVRLVPRDETTSYWVHCIAEPSIEIVSDAGTVVDRFDVPRGDLDRVVDDQIPVITREQVVADVVVDGRGRLHALRGLYVSDAGVVEKSQEVLVHDREGRVVERYRFGVQVVAFDLALDECSYLGVDARTTDVLRFPIPEREQ